MTACGIDSTLVCHNVSANIARLEAAHARGDNFVHSVPLSFANATTLETAFPEFEKWLQRAEELGMWSVDSLMPMIAGRNAS